MKSVQPNTTRERSTHFKYYANATGDIDILADGPNHNDQTPCAEVHVFTGGSLSVLRLDDTTITMASVPDGYVMPASIKKILATGTTATNFVVYW